MLQCMPFLLQILATLAQNLAMMLPFWTLILSTSLSWSSGRPSGCVWLRSGIGAGHPCSSFHCGIGISLALVNVPHGGPEWTNTSSGSSRSRRTVALHDFFVRSIFKIGTLVLWRLPFQSMPVAANPASCRAAVRPACPQQISRVFGENDSRVRFVLGIVAYSLSALRWARSFRIARSGLGIVKDGARFIVYACRGKIAMKTGKGGYGNDALR